jgi:uncharacterized protein (TIGR00730 family)
MKKNICIFCSSSNQIDQIYFEIAQLIAFKISELNYTLVFGGSNVGLMKHMAEHIKQTGGYLIGVIPQRIAENNLACQITDELIITKDMHERKAKLAMLSDVFIALPGGFGTLEELSEVITHKQLGYHHKPIIILNINGFYNSLLAFFETCYTEKFAKPEYKELYFVTNSIDAAFEYITNYKPNKTIRKWY